jgi:enoyl-CoA hydratase/carnithine racemase
MSAIPQHAPSILLREDRGGVCTLTMNRPLQMNLLTTEMLEALQKAFDSLMDDGSIRVVILAAAGKGFCAGHDLRELRALKELPRIEELFDRCSRMMQTITALPQPVIARVQGAAAAAGCQLVAQCDLAVACAAAKFTTPGVTWGFFCSTPGVAVGRNVSRKRAMEIWRCCSRATWWMRTRRSTGGWSTASCRPKVSSRRPTGWQGSSPRSRRCSSRRGSVPSMRRWISVWRRPTSSRRG